MSNQTFFWAPALAMWWRDVIRFLRQRNRIIGALATPLVFWILLGSGLAGSFRLGENPASYLNYFFPGTLVLIMLFTAIFSTISVIEDRREGFLQGVLVAPVRPAAIVMGKFLGGTTLAFLQAALFCVLAPFVGFHILWQQWPLLAGVFILVGFAMTGLGFIVAWPMDSTQGFHAIMNIFLMPLWMMSGALFPAATTGGWVWWVYVLNPVTYCVAAIRHSMGVTDVPGMPGFSTSLLYSGLFAVAVFGISLWLVTKRRKAS